MKARQCTSRNHWTLDASGAKCSAYRARASQESFWQHIDHDNLLWRATNGPKSGSTWTTLSIFEFMFAIWTIWTSSNDTGALSVVLSTPRYVRHLLLRWVSAMSCLSTKEFFQLWIKSASRVVPLLSCLSSILLVLELH